MSKTICMFCGKEHKVKPPLCEAKADLMDKLVKEHGFTEAMRLVESGAYDLEGEAQKIVSEGNSFLKELKKL